MPTVHHHLYMAAMARNGSNGFPYEQRDTGGYYGSARGVGSALGGHVPSPEAMRRAVGCSWSSLVQLAMVVPAVAMNHFWGAMADPKMDR